MNPTLIGSAKWSGLLGCAMLCWLVTPIRAQEKGMLLARAETAGTGFFNVSPEAGLLAFSAQDRTGKPVWDINLVSLKTGKSAGKITFSNLVWSPTFSKDGKTLAWLNTDGQIVLRDLASGKDRSVTYREPVRKKEKPGETLTLAPNGRIAAINGGGRGLQFVDLEADRLIPGEPIYEAHESNIHFSPDGKTVYLNSPSATETIEAYDLATKKRLATLSPRASSRYYAVSPDGKTLAITEPQLQLDPKVSQTTLLQRHIVLWDPVANQEKAKFRVAPPTGSGRRFGSVTFSPDGQTIAYSYLQQDGDAGRPYVGFIDATSGKTVGAMRTPGGHNNLAKLMYMPDGKSIIVISFGAAEVYRVPALKTPADGPAVPDSKSPADGPVVDLLVKGSVWVSENPSRILTILERKGETFRARVIHPAYDREVAGTIKDGKISWLAKDVQAARGGKGGDNEGTIFPDGSIDFVADGGKVRYTLKLKKSQ